LIKLVYDKDEQKDENINLTDEERDSMYEAFKKDVEK
jgi:hypothetical protein